MSATRSYRQFRIVVRPSPDTNDQEVRFFGDGEDLIAEFWHGMMGLDPADILVTPCPLDASTQPHQATIARCDCGVISCGSIEVNIARTAQMVEWSWGAADSPMRL